MTSSGPSMRSRRPSLGRGDSGKQPVVDVRKPCGETVKVPRPVSGFSHDRRLGRNRASGWVGVYCAGVVTIHEGGLGAPGAVGQVENSTLLSGTWGGEP